MKPRKCFITRNTYVKYHSSSTNCSKVISKVKVTQKWVKLQGQGHRVKKIWYPRKGLLTGNIHVKYKSFTTHCSKLIRKVKVFKKWVKHQVQGHRIKIMVPTERSYHREYLCELSYL